MRYFIPFSDVEQLNEFVKTTIDPASSQAMVLSSKSFIPGTVGPAVLFGQEPGVGKFDATARSRVFFKCFFGLRSPEGAWEIKQKTWTVSP